MILTMKTTRNFIFVVLMSLAADALADIQLGATRVVYPEDKREVSLAVRNLSRDGTPYLIQSWLQDENEQPTSMLVFPPLFRLEPGSSRFVRIMSVDATAPTDRESLYWLTVKAIPASEKNPRGLLQAVVSQKLKVFYRPKALAQKKSASYDALRFSVNAPGILQVVNPTPYYISFFSVEADGQEVAEADLLRPFETARYKLPAQGVSGIDWRVIDEYGAVSAVHHAEVKRATF